MGGFEEVGVQELDVLDIMRAMLLVSLRPSGKSSQPDTCLVLKLVTGDCLQTLQGKIEQVSQGWAQT